jgi:hypothetical protein
VVGLRKCVRQFFDPLTTPFMADASRHVSQSGGGFRIGVHVPGPSSAPRSKVSLSPLIASGHGLKSAIILPARQDADRCRVAGEWAVGEGANVKSRNRHGTPMEQPVGFTGRFRSNWVRCSPSLAYAGVSRSPSALNSATSMSARIASSICRRPNRSTAS